MNNLILRTLSGIVFIVLVLSMLYLNHYLFALLMLIFAIIGQLEYFQFSNKNYSQSLFIAGIASGFVSFSILIMLFANRFSNWPILFGIPTILLLVYIILKITKQENLNNFFSKLLFSLVYIIIPFSILYGLYFIQWPFEFRAKNTSFILIVFLLIWINDTMAYLVGSQLGKTKLAPKISPKKTWEGFAGGAFFTAVIAAFIVPYIIGLAVFQSVILALIVVIFGTLGDLFESRLKRRSGVKDSGNIIPGHGGVLDRLDSVIFAGPAVYLFLLFLYH